MNTTAIKSGIDEPVDKKKLFLSAGAVVLSLGVLTFVVLRATAFAPTTANEVSRYRAVIDSETGETIEKFGIQEGVGYPWKNPKTDKNTLFPAEFCFWTKDGKATLKPTFVLLNELVNKPGDTICPDCGRKVFARNPMPPVDLLQQAAKTKN
jgi:hypothetical protein